jgi:hypothetical protein
VRQALLAQVDDEFALKADVQFHCGEVKDVNSIFDTAFVPYLLGVKNGIEKTEDIVIFMQQMFQRVPRGSVLITPTRGTKEFYLSGRRYFTTTPYKTFQAIPALKEYVIVQDKYWFRTQGLVVLSRVCSP